MAKKEKVSIMDEYASDRPLVMHSTGIKALDDISGGGLMEGALYAFWGEPGTGKSSLCAQIAKKFCDDGFRVAYIDSEKSLNDVQKEIYGLTEYCKDTEAKGDRLLRHLNTVETFKRCDSCVKDLVEEGITKLIIIDSDSELLARNVEEMDVESKVIGEHARQSQIMLNNLKVLVHENNLIAIVLFQARANIQTFAAYGAPDKKQAGGFSGKHIPDAIMKVGKGATLKDSDNKPIGHVMKLTFEKNKIYKPESTEVQFLYGYGVAIKIGAIDAAIERGLIEKSGNSYLLGNGSKYVGKKALYDMTDEDFSYLDSILSE